MQLPGAKIHDIKMVMKTGTCTSNVSLVIEFQKHLSNAAYKHGVIDQGKYKKRASKNLDIKGISCLGGYWFWAQRCEDVL